MLNNSYGYVNLGIRTFMACEIALKEQYCRTH